MNSRKLGGAVYRAASGLTVGRASRGQRPTGAAVPLYLLVQRAEARAGAVACLWPHRTVRSQTFDKHGWETW